MRDKRLTAIHEAGHAVAAYLLGRSVREATIKADQDSLGHVTLLEGPPEWAYGSNRWGLPLDAVSRRRMETAIMVRLAGGMAVAKILGVDLTETGSGLERVGPDEVGISWGDRGDTLTIAELASDNPAEAFAYQNWLEERTKSLLSHPLFEGLVNALADVLLADETLSGRRVRTILNDTRRAIVESWNARQRPV